MQGYGAAFAKPAAYAHQHRSWVRHTHEIHTWVGRTLPPPSLIGMDELGAYTAQRPGFQRLAVWRDPVDWFAAFYGESCLEGVPHRYARFVAAGSGAQWSDLLRFARWEVSKNRPADMEEHMRPQSATWSREQVDAVRGRRRKQIGPARHS